MSSRTAHLNLQLSRLNLFVLVYCSIAPFHGGPLSHRIVETLTKLGTKVATRNPGEERGLWVVGEPP